MLCLEGIARALNIFNGRQRDIQYSLADMSGRQPLRLTVQQSATCSEKAEHVVLTARSV
jgi:hypothetical protein